MATLAELLAARKKATSEAPPTPTPIPAPEPIPLQPVLEPSKQSTALSSKQEPAPRDLRDPRLDRDLVAKLDQLAWDLQEATPNLGESLRYIHRALLADPVQVTILSDTERSIFFQGLMRQSTVAIIAKATKTRTPKAGKEALSVDDFM